MVARWGARTAAELGAAAAGPLVAEDLERLARAARRYETHARARPQGWPAGAAAALQHIGHEAAAHGGRPELVRFAVRLLDQVSRRMRAIATADDPERVAQAQRRAERRHPEPQRLPFTFRQADVGDGSGPRAPSWWIAGGPGAEPQIGADGYLQVDADAPGPGDRELRRDADRDTLLLAGQWPSPTLDGRQAMADRARDLDARPRALPYVVGPDRDRERPDDAILELARLSGLPINELARMVPDRAERMLAQLRDEQAELERARTAEHRRAMEQLLLRDRPQPGGG